MKGETIYLQRVCTNLFNEIDSFGLVYRLLVGLTLLLLISSMLEGEKGRNEGRESCLAPLRGCSLEIVNNFEEKVLQTHYPQGFVILIADEESMDVVFIQLLDDRLEGIGFSGKY